jgi:hypothetical protein
LGELIIKKKIRSYQAFIRFYQCQMPFLGSIMQWSMKRHQGGKMRSILVLVMSGAMLLLPGAVFAETETDPVEECRIKCHDENSARQATCPQPDEDTQEARAQCLQESESAYAGCLSSCPKPAPAEAPADN